MSDDDSRNDQDAVVATLVANHRRFLAFLEPRLGSRQDAEDVLQEAFVRSLHKSDEVRDPEKALAWFYRLLRNAIVDHFRRNAAGARSLEEFARRLSKEDEGPDPDLERVVCACVKDLVPILKPEYGDVITRVDLQDGDVTAVAAALGISPGNVRVRLHRARAALRKEVVRTCRSCATHGCLDCTCGGSGGSPARG